jgi:hypothetical protein
MAVEARAAVQFFAAGVAVHFANLEADFIDRFQAVGRKTRTGDEDALEAALRQGLELLLSIRLQPRRLAEERLIRPRPRAVRPIEPLDESARRPLDVQGIRVSALCRPAECRESSGENNRAATAPWPIPP